MKFSILATLLASTANLASAHYFFDKLIVNGRETKSYEFVLENTRPEKYNPTKFVNTRDDMTPFVNDFRCNKGAFQSQSRTGVAEVAAGEKLGFKLAVGATMKHPGPGLVYMSKAPGGVKNYQGDGDWFKVFEEGICNEGGDVKGDAWCSWDKDTIEFTVPRTIQSGEYLVRVEHIGLHGAHDGQAEFYTSCAMVKVTGGGNAVPSATAKIPGIYKATDEAVNFSVWGGMKPYTVFPGPAIFQDGQSSAAAPVSNVEKDEEECPCKKIRRSRVFREAAVEKAEA